MQSGRPLFPGSNNNDQLDKIFRMLGTPTDEIYPGIVDLPEYRPDTYRTYARTTRFSDVLPGLEEEGVDLLERMLQYDPARRISAKDALNHAYFADLPESLRVGGIMGPPIRALVASDGAGADAADGAAAARDDDGAGGGGGGGGGVADDGR